MKAIVLAAGVGKRFGARTKRVPKCLIPIEGRTLLSRYFEAFREVGIKEAVVVVGHLAGLVKAEARREACGVKVRFVTNLRFRHGSVLSLRTASSFFKGGAIIMDADVFFPPRALSKLLKAKRSAFLIDSRSKSSGEEMMVMAQKGHIVKIAKKTDPSLKILGEATGIFRLDGKDALSLKKILDDFFRKKIWDVEYEDAYTVLMEKSRLGTVSVGNVFWSEMDFEEDFEKISAQARRESGGSQGAVKCAHQCSHK